MLTGAVYLIRGPHRVRPTGFSHMSTLKQPLQASEHARFLVVDDEPALLRAMRRVLQAAGRDWTVVCARHGLEALERLANESFDAIVLDLHMPVMDGLTLLRHLVAEYPEVWRIVHSSHIDPMGRTVLTELAHEVLAKPAHPQLIVDTLERALAGIEPHAPRSQIVRPAPGRVGAHFDLAVEDMLFARKQPT